MNWNNIDGWFDFAAVYDEAILSARNGDRLIEIGSWLGKSTAYLAQKAKESGKDIKIFAIDTWLGVIGNDVHQNIISVVGENGSIFDNFNENMRQCGVSDFVIPIKKCSNEAFIDIKDQQISFVFIDGDHSYEAVKADLENYYPLVRRGGIIAGHDFWAEQINRAVTEKFGNNVIKNGNCFVHYKNEN